MKTIVVFSDSHFSKIDDKLIKIIDEADYVFFLGDGLNSLDKVLFHKNFIGVKGNCDSINYSDEEVVEIEKVRILLTHGHKYHVKRNLDELILRTEELKCNAVFYGHTHIPKIDITNSITCICPGSTSYPRFGNPSYAYVIIHEGKIVSKIVNL